MPYFYFMYLSFLSWSCAATFDPVGNREVFQLLSLSLFNLGSSLKCNMVTLVLVTHDRWSAGSRQRSFGSLLNRSVAGL